MMAADRRVPQLDDDVVMTVTFPAETEEWAEDLLADLDAADSVERTGAGLVVTGSMGGNCNGVYTLRCFMEDIEEALSEGDIDPMEFEVKVTARERVRAS